MTGPSCPLLPTAVLLEPNPYPSLESQSFLPLMLTTSEVTALLQLLLLGWRINLDSTFLSSSPLV